MGYRDYTTIRGTHSLLRTLRSPVHARARGRTGKCFALLVKRHEKHNIVVACPRCGNHEFLRQNALKLEKSFGTAASKSVLKS